MPMRVNILQSRGCMFLALNSMALKHKTLMARMQTMHYSVSADGIIVGVDTGLKQKRTNPQSDPDYDYFLHPQQFAFNPLVSRFDTHFSSAVATAGLSFLYSITSSTRTACAINFLRFAKTRILASFLSRRDVRVTP